MCAGGIDPKYGLSDLEAGFRASRRETVAEQQDNNRKPGPGLIGWAMALIARFQRKEVTHG